MATCSRNERSTTRVNSNLAEGDYRARNDNAILSVHVNEIAVEDEMQCWRDMR